MIPTLKLAARYFARITGGVILGALGVAAIATAITYASSALFDFGGVWLVGAAAVVVIIAAASLSWAIEDFEAAKDKP